MKNDSKNVTVEATPFTSLLTFVFIVLKLCKVISWSWWWVLSPLWISAALVVFLFLIVIIIAFFSDN